MKSRIKAQLGMILLVASMAFAGSCPEGTTAIKSANPAYVATCWGSESDERCEKWKEYARNHVQAEIDSFTRSCEANRFNHAFVNRYQWPLEREIAGGRTYGYAAEVNCCQHKPSMEWLAYPSDHSRCVLACSEEYGTSCHESCSTTACHQACAEGFSSCVAQCPRP